MVKYSLIPGKTPTPESLAYFAGRVDLSCMLNVTSGSAHVGIKQSNLETLLEFKRFFGGNLTQTNPWRAKWNLYGYKCVPFLELFIPHVRERRFQLEKLLEWTQYPARSAQAIKLKKELSAMKRGTYEAIIVD